MFSSLVSDGKVIFSRREQPENTALSRVTISLGISIPIRLEQSANAHEPIFLIVSGKVT